MKGTYFNCYLILRRSALDSGRAVDPHSFFANPDPAAFLMRIRIQLKKLVTNYPTKSFLELKVEKKLIKSKKKTKELVQINFWSFNKN